MTKAEILKRAAWYLDDGAKCCANGGKVYGKWADDPYARDMKHEHDEQRKLARELRKMSRR
jgi:hypothetical protein